MEPRAPMNDPRPDPPALKPGAAPGFFSWFPWEKLLIWALFLLVVYVLRHFFFIIFMTFMITYIMSGIVRSVTRMASPHQERPWLQRVVAVVAFALLLGVLYGMGAVLYHPLKSQAEGLVNRVRSVNYENMYNNFLGKTFGAWKFESEYRGKDGEERKKRELAEWIAKEGSEYTFEEFRKSAAKIKNDFQSQFEEAEGEKRYQLLIEQGKEKADSALELWLLETIEERKFSDGRKFQDARADLLKQWDERNLSAARYLSKFPNGGPPTYEEFLKSPAFLVERELELKKSFIARELAKDEQREKSIAAFKTHLGQLEYERLLREERLEVRFRQFYQSQAHTYDYQRFKELDSADTKEAFNTLLLGVNETPEEREKRIQESFKTWKQNKLGAEAVKDVEFLQISNLQKWLGEKLPEVTGFITGVGVNLFELVIQFVLSLMLSFFITFDLPRLRRGLHKLEQSRVRDFYHEIAPGLINFGRLIGRAFQAQGVIALCNTFLTYCAIWKLGIQYQIFLCAIVFICSFIPVLGVVLSSVPIALVAMFQKEVPGVYPEGDIFIALWAVGAILVIHFIETSILNPKILGDMLHLHPVLVLGILAVGEYFFKVWGLLLGVPVAVYIIRYVILAEDPHLPAGPPAAAAVPVRAKAGTGADYAPKETVKTPG